MFQSCRNDVFHRNNKGFNNLKLTISKTISLDHLSLALSGLIELSQFPDTVLIDLGIGTLVYLSISLSIKRNNEANVDFTIFSDECMMSVSSVSGHRPAVVSLRVPEPDG